MDNLNHSPKPPLAFSRTTNTSNAARSEVSPEKPRVAMETNYSRFNNTPAILARGTRSVSSRTMLILLDALNLKNDLKVHAALATKFDFDVKKLQSVYSYNSYLDVAEYLRANYLDKLNPEDGYNELGYRITQVYFQGVAGQVVKTMARVMGPQNGAKQFVRTMSNTLSWGTHELEEVRSNYVRYHKALVGGPPPLMLGLIRAALEAGGAKLTRATYTVYSIDEDDVVYEVEWK